jgi:hypothetical protein
METHIKKKIVITVFVAFMLGLLYYQADSFMARVNAIVNRPVPTLIVKVDPAGGTLAGGSASVSALGIAIQISENDSWKTVGMMLTTFLGLFAGIKIINKYIK